MADVVLLNSGGIDSRVAAAMLRASGASVHSLFIDWNPASSFEAGRAARGTADAYCAGHEVFRWPVDWRTWYPSLRKATTPYAFLGTLALGVQYAHHMGANFIASGVRREVHDADVLGIVADLLSANRFGTEKAFLAPVVNMSEADVTAKARELGVDLDSTWSCPEAPQCGQCSSCQRRVREGVAL